MEVAKIQNTGMALTVAKSVGVSETRVSAIMKARETPIRLATSDNVIASCQKLISQLGMYGVHEIQDGAADLLASFLTRNYPGLAVMEVRFALEAKASGDIEPGPEGTFYSGKFSLNAIGAILNAYQVYRNKIVAAIEKEEDAIKAAQADKERKEQNKEFLQDWLAGFPGNLAQDATITGFDSILVAWYDWANKAGLIELDAEMKKAYWERAKIMAATEIEKHNEALRMSAQFERIIRGETEKETLKTVATRIGKQLILWEQYILPERLALGLEKPE